MFFTGERERKEERRRIPRSSANRPPSEEEETYFSCRDNARSNASFVVVVAFFFSVSLLLPSVSTKSFPEEDIFNCGERKRLKEKDEKKRQAKKKVPDRLTDEKKRRGRFLGLLVVLVILKTRVHCSCILISFLLFFLRFFVFLSPKRSIHSSRTSRWSRARVYIYIYLETRDLVEFHSRDETRKRERRKENDVHETTIPEEKGKRKKKDRIVFSERSFA